MFSSSESLLVFLCVHTCIAPLLETLFSGRVYTFSFRSFDFRYDCKRGAGGTHDFSEYMNSLAG